MNSDLFNRYVWLVDVVNHAGKITYEEISRMWLDAPINEERAPMALRTFHNHREAVESLFGVKVACNRRGGNYYYIDREDSANQSTDLRIWMLQTLCNSPALNNSTDILDRVLVEHNPEEKAGLQTILEAMKLGCCVKIYSMVPLTKKRRTEFTVEPYCVKFWDDAWYLLAKETGGKEFMLFNLSRVLNIELSGVRSRIDENFNASDFFRQYFGVDVDTSKSLTPVRLKVYDGTRDLLRTRPLHSTQKEVQAAHDSSIFEYNLVPGQAFINKIISMGPDVEVLAPDQLRTEIRNWIGKMQEQYAE